MDSRLEAFSTITEIAKDVLHSRGRHLSNSQVITWSGAYTHWKGAAAQLTALEIKHCIDEARFSLSEA